MPKKPSKNLALTEAQIEAAVDKYCKPYYLEVGRIVACWAMLEWNMDRIIWDLAGVEQPLGACITAQLSGPTPRLRVIKALVALLEAPPELLTKINKFGSELQVPQEARNRAVHDAWFVGYKSKKVMKQVVAVINNRLEFKQQVMNVDELRATYEISKGIVKKFNTLVTEIRSLVRRPSPETHPELFARVGHRGEGKLGPGSDLLMRLSQQEPFDPLSVPPEHWATAERAVAQARARARKRGKKTPGQT